MERQFEHHLSNLKTRIIKMSSLVEEQLEYAIKAVDEGNKELANLVIERDAKVNNLDRKIEKTCQKIIALSQPVAMDLRIVITALTINTNLERIGDLAENIARNILVLGHKPIFIDETKYSDMTVLVKRMIEDALNSFNNQDAGLAKKVLLMDDQLDSLFAENRTLLIAAMKEDSSKIDEALTILEICRHIERIGDHATNIAEDVYFIVEAQLIKHKYEKYINDEIDLEDEGNEELDR